MTVQSLINKPSNKRNVMVIKKGDELTVLNHTATHYIVETKSKQRHSIRKEDVRVVNQ